MRKVQHASASVRLLGLIGADRRGLFREAVLVALEEDMDVMVIHEGDRYSIAPGALLDLVEETTKEPT